jgi:hypothetical protein
MDIDDSPLWTNWQKECLHSRCTPSAAWIDVSLTRVIANQVVSNLMIVRTTTVFVRFWLDPPVTVMPKKTPNNDARAPRSRTPDC